MKKIENKTKIILSDKEIKKVFEIKNKCRGENLGVKFEEIKKEIPDFDYNNQDKKFEMISNILFATGDINNNPKELQCKECDSKFVIEYTYGDVFYRLFNGNEQQKKEEKEKLKKSGLFINVSPYAKEDKDYDYCCLSCGYEWNR